MKKKVFCFLTGLIALSPALRAQDPHFSQYYKSPQTLNPAMTGYFNGDYRFIGNYRQQWMAVGDPYITASVGFDTKLMRKKQVNDVFALGVNGLYDKSLNGGLKSTFVSGSLAYTKALDQKNKFGLGFQFTYATRFIYMDKLTFATQFNGTGFDPNLPSMENAGVQEQGYFDVNTGLLYVHSAPKTEVYVGVSAYHINQPRVGFFENEKYRLRPRYTINAGSRFSLGGGKSKLYLSGLFMEQGGATEENIGIVYGASANESVTVLGGIWYRVNDAVIPYIGMQANNFQIDLSYDVNNSSLKNYRSKNGSFELSITITGKKATSAGAGNQQDGRIY